MARVQNHGHSVPTGGDGWRPSRSRLPPHPLTSCSMQPRALTPNLPATHVAPGEVEHGIAVRHPLGARLVGAPVVGHLAGQLARGVHNGHKPLLVCHRQQLAVVVDLWTEGVRRERHDAVRGTGRARGTEVQESNTSVAAPLHATPDLGVLRRKGGGAHAARVVHHRAAACSLHRKLGHKGAAVHCREVERGRECGRWAAPASGGGPVWFGFEPRHAGDSFSRAESPRRGVSGARGPRTWPPAQLAVQDLQQHGLRLLVVLQHAAQPLLDLEERASAPPLGAELQVRLCRPWAPSASVRAPGQPGSEVERNEVHGRGAGGRNPPCHAPSAGGSSKRQAGAARVPPDMRQATAFTARPRIHDCSGPAVGILHITPTSQVWARPRQTCLDACMHGLLVHLARRLVCKCAVLQQLQPDLNVTVVATNHPWAPRRQLVLLVVVVLLLLVLPLPRCLPLPRSSVLLPPLPPASAHAAKS